MVKKIFFHWKLHEGMMFSRVEISNITNSSLNLAETKFYEVGLVPPCLLWVLQPLSRHPSDDHIMPRTEELFRAQAFHRDIWATLTVILLSSKGWKRISANWECVPLFTPIPACSFPSSQGYGLRRMSILWFRIAVTSWIHSGIGLIYMISFYP